MCQLWISWPGEFNVHNPINPDADQIAHTPKTTRILKPFKLDIFNVGGLARLCAPCFDAAGYKFEIVPQFCIALRILGHAIVDEGLIRHFDHYIARAWHLLGELKVYADAC